MWFWAHRPLVLIYYLGTFRLGNVIPIAKKDHNLQTRLREGQILKICPNGSNAAQKSNEILLKSLDWYKIVLR